MGRRWRPQEHRSTPLQREESYEARCEDCKSESQWRPNRCDVAQSTNIGTGHGVVLETIPALIRKRGQKGGAEGAGCDARKIKKSSGCGDSCGRQPGPRRGDQGHKEADRDTANRFGDDREKRWKRGDDPERGERKDDFDCMRDATPINVRR